MSEKNLEFSWNAQDIFEGKTKFALLVLNTEIIDENRLITLWNKACFRITVDGGTNRWHRIITKNQQCWKPNQRYFLKTPNFEY